MFPSLGQRLEVVEDDTFERRAEIEQRYVRRADHLHLGHVEGDGKVCAILPAPPPP